MPEYTHTLIPTRVDFVPAPDQIRDFLKSLTKIGATPLHAAVSVSMPSGKVRTVTMPFTEQTLTLPILKFKKLKGFSSVPTAVEGLADYNVIVEGKGPPKLPAFAFDFEGGYDFLIRCCVRPMVVSTSDWHDETPLHLIGQTSAPPKAVSFGEPCSPQQRLGIFHNPNTLAIIEVPNAGCARFWIEFEYGKMLFPRIEDRLDLMEPEIVAAAAREFGLPLVQGCRWCA
jgi:hypothetical protein